MFIFISLAWAVELSYFETGLFESSRDPKLYQVEIGLENQDMLIGAFGFFNQDKYCDIFVIDGNRSSLKVLTWNHEDLVFTFYTESSVLGTIENITPGDFNYDGKLDVLVTFVNSTEKYLQVFTQDEKNLTAGQVFKIDYNSQPAVLDINGDKQLEIVNNKGDTVMVYKYNEGFEEIGRINTLFGCSYYEDIKFSHPHSVGFIDLNKDCSSDLFITFNTGTELVFEVWLNAKNSTFCKVWSEAAPPGSRQVSFADLDRDGIVDIVFPVCLGSNCSEKNEIHVIYNKNQVSNDCTFNRSLLLNFSIGELSKENPNYEIVELKDKFYENEDFPITIRFGDFNVDGYPDALVILTNSTGPYVELLNNLANKTKRVLTPDSSETSQMLKQVKDPVLACFFDLNDRGILDIIIMSKNDQFSITAFFNYFQNQNFHLKALALNGHSKKGYSSAYPGAVFMFSLTELNMNVVVIESTQMPQSAFYALNTPYCIFGLGRTNSYIEQFFIALPVRGQNSKIWTPIIPNSYLIVSPVNSTENWFLELFAAPTDQIEIIIGVCSACMLLIGTVVVINYCKEKRESRRLFGISINL